MQCFKYIFPIYLSFDAFSSKTASFMEEPSNAMARHRILVVFPEPGGPYITF
jgi:hypothetical protein